MSGISDDGTLVHTVRANGAVGHALYGAPVHSLVGVRGPYGTSWNLRSARGCDLVVVAGGTGLAALRPVLRTVLDRRASYGNVALLAGARTPGDLLFRDELASWAASGDVDVRLTADTVIGGWTGAVGAVTGLLDELTVTPLGTYAFVSGPDPMMLRTAARLTELGVPPHRIALSFERRLRCGVGYCGDCRLDSLLMCTAGPVVSYAFAAPLLVTRRVLESPQEPIRRPEMRSGSTTT